MSATIDFSHNFELLAEQWAHRLDCPFSTHGHAFTLDMQLIAALFSGVYPETIDSIQCDPPLFAARVAAYRHGASYKGAA